MIKYFMKEFVNSVKAAKLSFLLSLITNTIAILFVLIAIGLLGFSRKIEEQLKDKIGFVLILEDSLNSEQIQEVDNQLSEIKYVKSYKYISKEEAAKKFIKETGEDFRAILENNPLPASFEVKIKNEYLDSGLLPKAEKVMSEINYVTEVVVQKSLVLKILDWINSLNLYIIIFASLITAISLYLVFSTNKIIIENKRKQIETMKLVGAKNFVIKFPYVINGFVIGILSSSLILILLRIVFFIFNSSFDNSFKWIATYPVFNLVIYGIGILLGVLGSALALGRIPFRIVKI